MNSEMGQYSLKDVVAVLVNDVQGATYSTGKALLRLGARIVVLDPDCDRGAAIEKELRREFDPNRVAFIQADISDKKGVQELAQEVVSKFGRVDLILDAKTAGLGLAVSALHTMESNRPRMWEQVTTHDTTRTSLTRPTNVANVSMEDEKLKLCRSLLSTLEQQYSEWKRSSFLDKPMMRQEFAKLTEMSIEDMISTLAKLEEGLRNQTPVTGFVEPLRKLASFYRRSSNVNGPLSQPSNISNGRLSDPEILASMIVNDAQKTLLNGLA
jgi:hypothetical protein